MDNRGNCPYRDGELGAGWRREGIAVGAFGRPRDGIHRPRMVVPDATPPPRARRPRRWACSPACRARPGPSRPTPRPSTPTRPARTSCCVTATRGWRPGDRAAAAPPRGAGGAGCSRPVRTCSARPGRATTGRCRWIRHPAPTSGRTTCGATTGTSTSVWLRPQQFGVDPRVLVAELVRDLPYPAATVGASPSGRGLTGLASWFWVDGYSDKPIVDTVEQFGMTVTVEATPVATDWDFGDGTVGRRTRARRAASGPVDGRPRVRSARPADASVSGPCSGSRCGGGSVSVRGRRSRRWCAPRCSTTPSSSSRAALVPDR